MSLSIFNMMFSILNLFLEYFNYICPEILQNGNLTYKSKNEFIQNDNGISC